MRAAEPPLPLGTEPPAIALPALQHEVQQLDALRGKVVVVHFFATWCEPCRQELAGLSRLAAGLKDRPFAVLAVDVGEPELRVRRFFDKEPVPFPVLLDEDRAVLKAWRVAALPTSFVLDPAQTLRLYAAGPVDWNDPAAMDLLEHLATPAGAPVEGTLPPLTD